MGGRFSRALTRKFGPLPAWAWLGLLAGALLVYRRYKGKGASGVNNTGTPVDTSALNAPTPGSPVVLSPGESVYDPATGKLLTPGAGGDTTAPVIPPDQAGTDAGSAGGTDTGTAPPATSPRVAFPGRNVSALRRNLRRPPTPTKPKKKKRQRRSHLPATSAIPRRATPSAGRGSRSGSQGSRASLKHPLVAGHVRSAFAGAGDHSGSPAGGAVAAVVSPHPSRPRPTVPLVSHVAIARPTPPRLVSPHTQQVVTVPPGATPTTTGHGLRGGLGD